MRHRRLFLLAAGLVVGIALVSLAFVALRGPLAREAAEREWRQRLASVSDGRAAALELWLRDGLEDARLVASYPTVRYLAEGRSEGPLPFPAEQGARAHLDVVLGEAASAGSYAAVALLDRSGVEVARWSAGVPLAGDCAAAVLNTTSASRAGVGTCAPHHDRPLVLFAAPVGDTGVVAVVAAPAQQWLFPFLATPLLALSTAETVLVAPDHDSAVYISPLRFLVAPPFSVRRPLTLPGLAAARAFDPEPVVGNCFDYRGEPVIAATRRLQAGGWGLVTKVDVAEALLPVRQELALEVTALAGGLLALGVGGLALQRHVRSRRLRDHLADLEQREELRQALATSEQRLQAFFDAGAVGMLFGDVHGNVLDANDELLRIIGYTREELTAGQLRWVDITPVEFLPLDEERIREARERGACTPYEKQFVRKDGSRVWVLIGYHLLGERREESVAFTVDISKQKEAEARRETLQREHDQALERLELQVRSLPIGLLVTEPDLTMVEVNPAAERMFGFPAAELIGRDPFGIIIPESARAGVEDLLARLRNGDETLDGVNENLTRDGRTLTCHWFNAPLRDSDGNLVGVMAMVQDISERVRILRELEEREELLAETGRIAAVGGWEFDATTGRGTWTEEVARIHGVDPADPTSVGRGLSFYEGASRERIEAAVRAAVARGESYDLELELVTEAGERKWVRTIGHPVQEGGRTVKVRGSFQDISDRRRAEDALAESERALATLTSNLPGMAYRCANLPDWPMELVSEGSVALTGYSPGELQVGGVIAYGDLIVPEDRQLVWDAVQRAVRGGEAFELEYRITARDGTRRWVWERGRAIADGDGRVRALEGFIADITERRAALDEVRRARDRAQRYLELAGVMFVALDREGRVTLVNPKACEVLGAARDEILGRDWFTEFVPEAAQSRVRRTFQRLVAGEIEPMEYYENPVRTRSGETRLVAWHNSLLRDDGGTILGTLSSGEDVTESRTAAEALRALRLRLAEAEEGERRRLARELHDQVGQSLTALGINLSIVRQQIATGATAAVEQRLDDSRELVDEIVAQVRGVMAALRPSVLDDYGLPAALEWTAGRFRERTGIGCRVVAVEPERRLPAPVETALFRIAQEALTNVARHAGAASVTVELEIGEGIARLTVRDDGVGFDPSSVPPGRMGLAGMQERAVGVGGRLDVRSAIGKGVAVVAEVPAEMV